MLIMSLFILLVSLCTLILCQTTNVPQTEVLRPKEERTCVSGFICKHGYCVISNTLECICDAGWIGTFCEKNCSLYCGEHGSCFVYNGEQKCACDWQYTGTQCDELKNSQLTTTVCPECLEVPDNITENNDTFSNDIASFNESVLTDSFGFNNTVYSELITTTSLPPASSTAISTIKSVDITTELVTESTTSNSETSCPLTCGQFGKCRSLSNRTKICICETGYSGQMCELFQPTTTEFSDVTSKDPPPSTSQSTTISSLWSLDKRTCVPGFVCSSGYCNNIVNYQCACDPGWGGLLCDKKCPIVCNKNQICEIVSDGVAFCRCNWTHTGPSCETPRTYPNLIEGNEANPPWYWYLIGSCVVLLLILVLVPYCMWKRRDIFMMKILYMFQSYEDDDDKLFDAFVCYKSIEKDEGFVLRQLFPRLETEKNFKLCLHFRDFVPGETTPNNIIWAIENSRRTILVLSPEYVQSEFCRFEYQRAQHEMLKRKQRIVPILLEDMSSEENYMNQTLRTIINSTKCLKWPGGDNSASINKFWERLQLSLPKKRPDVNNKDSTIKAVESVNLRSVSQNAIASSTDENPSEYVRLSIDDDPTLNGRHSHGIRSDANLKSI